MTPERWRAVDAILLAALEREREGRDAFVIEACRHDEALRHEVVSLLAAHDAAPDDFLARPAAHALGLASLGTASRPQRSEGVQHTPSPGRMVAARTAIYVAVAALAVGVVGGWGLARSSLFARLTGTNATPWQPGGAARAIGADEPSDGLSLVVRDRTGRTLRTIPARRPWTPRFSPDGRRVAYGAFGAGRHTSDVWVTNVLGGATQRLTDDDADSNDPQWSPDGAGLAYSVNAPGGKDVAARRLAGGSPAMVASRPGTQFPSDWQRDGSALLVTEDAGPDRGDILVQPADGSEARPYAATGADETAARISPDGRWIAYTSDESGRAEVYLDSYPRPTRRAMISRGGGVHPVWRGDGRELYYWGGDSLVAVQMGAARGNPMPAIGAQAVLYRAPYQVSVNTMYDVSPDGERFVIVERR